MGVSGPGRVKATTHLSSGTGRLRCASCQDGRKAAQPSEPARWAPNGSGQFYLKPKNDHAILLMAKSRGYKNVYPSVTLSRMKDVGLRIRVQRELREQFLKVCRNQDKPAAQVIREFMRAYVEEHQVANDAGEAEKKEAQ